MRLQVRCADVRSFCRRTARLGLLVAYFVTAVGVPLPAGNLARKSGELFPCSDCACGCASAEQCWRSCCCHSLAERFAWAREHGVQPPEFAIAAARQSRIDLTWLVQPKKSCCARDMVAAAPKCCHSPHGCCSGHNRHDEDQSSENKANHVIGWKALNCQGHSANWIAAVPTLISANIEQVQQLALVEWLGPAFSEHASRVVDLPAIPPPQVV